MKWKENFNLLTKFPIIELDPSPNKQSPTTPHYNIKKMDTLKYFTISEMLASKTAKQNNIDNNPTDEKILAYIQYTLAQLDKIRERYGRPITIKSGYRCPILNKLVGGVPNSAHQIGYAADIVGYSNSKLFYLIKDMMSSGEIEVDQLIWEKGTKTSPAWVHVSFDESRKRGQIIYKL